MIRRPPRSTLDRSSAASDVYKRQLLHKEGVQGPYVMVGASLGSLYIRAFQRRFPEQVAGMVFIDGSHEEAITFMVDGKPTPISHLSAAELQTAYKAYE